MFHILTGKKPAAIGMAFAVLISAMAAAPQPAEARRGVGIGLGIAAGVIAGAAIGGYAYGYPRYYRYSRTYVADDGGCYLGPRQCRRVGGDCGTNRFGDYVCRGGTVRCYRPTVCD
jgi:hypothetical protein